MFQTEILIWIQLSSERCRSKALKVAATVNGNVFDLLLLVPEFDPIVSLQMNGTHALAEQECSLSRWPARRGTCCW